MGIEFGKMAGLEMALRSMGLGSVLDAAKQLAESGAVQKILQFADGLEEQNARLARIDEALGLEPWQRKDRGSVIDGVATIRGAAAEPGSGPDAGGGS